MIFMYFQSMWNHCVCVHNDFERVVVPPTHPWEWTCQCWCHQRTSPSCPRWHLWAPRNPADSLPQRTPHHQWGWFKQLELFQQHPQHCCPPIVVAQLYQWNHCKCIRNDKSNRKLLMYLLILREEHLRLIILGGWLIMLGGWCKPLLQQTHQVSIIVLSTPCLISLLSLQHCSHLWIVFKVLKCCVCVCDTNTITN